MTDCWAPCTRWNLFEVSKHNKYMRRTVNFWENSRILSAPYSPKNTVLGICASAGNLCCIPLWIQLTHGINWQSHPFVGLWLWLACSALWIPPATFNVLRENNNHYPVNVRNKIINRINLRPHKYQQTVGGWLLKILEWMWGNAPHTKQRDMNTR